MVLHQHPVASNDSNAVNGLGGAQRDVGGGCDTDAVLYVEPLLGRIDVSLSGRVSISGWRCQVGDLLAVQRDRRARRRHLIQAVGPNLGVEVADLGSSQRRDVCGYQQSERRSPGAAVRRDEDGVCRLVGQRAGQSAGARDRRVRDRNEARQAQPNAGNGASAVALRFYKCGSC